MNPRTRIARLEAIAQKIGKAAQHACSHCGYPMAAVRTVVRQSDSAPPLAQCTSCGRRLAPETGRPLHDLAKIITLVPDGDLDA